jgi:uncharacterized membrane-anchored protein YhcB (DUF1043 family)
MTHHKKHSSTGKKIAGAALVAGAALGAAAVALSDKKTRDQVLKSANALKDEAMKHLDKDVTPLQKKAEKAVAEGKKALDKKVKEYK